MPVVRTKEYTEGQINPEFRSDPTKVVVFKYGLPVMLFLGEITVFTGADHLLELALLPTLTALFYFSAAQLRVEHRGLRIRYFYFLKWKEVSYEEILLCKVSLAPAMGVLKLRRFVPPWGKIYFILGGPKLQMAWPAGQSKMTAAINALREGRWQSKAESSTIDGKPNNKKRDAVACAVVFLVGVAYFSVVAILFPSPPNLSPKVFPRMAAYERLLEALLRWPWNLLMACALTATIFGLRFGKKAWLLAFALGGLLVAIVARNLS